MSSFERHVLIQQIFFWVFLALAASGILLLKFGSGDAFMLPLTLGILGLMGSAFWPCAHCGKPSGFIFAGFFMALMPLGACFHCGQRYVGFNVVEKSHNQTQKKDADKNSAS